jgi:hypothetical protein
VTLPSVVLLAALALGAAAPGALANTRTSAFAPADPGVRPAALGGAYTAVGGEPNALYWNPAALFFQKGKTLEATYMDLYSLGAAQRSSISYGWKKTFDLPYFQEGDRVSVRRDDQTGPAYAFGIQSLFFDLDDAGYSEISLDAAAAWGYGERLAVGLLGRLLLVSSDFDEVSAIGYNFGVGLAWNYSSRERIAVASPSLLSRLFWKFDSTERLPLGVSFGWMREFGNRLLFAADLELREGEGGIYRIAGGGEWWAVENRVALRAGYRHVSAGVASQNHPTFGAAVHFLRLRVDYTFSMGPDVLGDTHRVALLIVL